MWLICLLLASVVFIIATTVRLRLHPFLALLLAAYGFGLLAGMEPAEVVNSVNVGFGGTLGAIGIVILAGSIIGTFLEKSGGALRLAESCLRVSGDRHVPAAMGLVGYVVSMPVFCDSGFVILSALNRALAHRARVSLAAGAIALSLGLYATHTMVPPTPGPVAAAGILEADLGRVILWGLLVSAVALLGGWLFAVTVASRVQIPVHQASPLGSGAAEKESGGELPSTEGSPSLWRALLPILVPIALIVLRSLTELPGRPFGEGSWAQVLGFAGQPAVALLVGVGLALLLPRSFERSMLAPAGWVGEALVAAAGIIVITGAGGAFGKVLQNSGIADVIGQGLAGASLGIWLPFAIAAGIKTAQGSSTVAIITTAGLLAPLLDSLGLQGENARALVVVAIGAGSMVVSHANDSYFWVVTQFSGMDLRTGYKLQTLGTLVQGSVAALTVWVLSLLMP
jgi:GntP family gluconate:H+ symporter